jgi:hypothetical protein
LRVGVRLRYVINPRSRYCKNWDCVTLYALLFVAVVTPWEIAFSLTDATVAEQAIVGDSIKVMRARRASRVCVCRLAEQREASWCVSRGGERSHDEPASARATPPPPSGADDERRA